MTSQFTTLTEFQQILNTVVSPDETARHNAQAHNAQLTKPAGSLGRLEDLAIWYAAWRGDSKPQLKSPQALIFAGNHGICAQGVSAFPPEVTEQMVLNFKHGGAAINQLCKTFGVDLQVHALSLDTPTQDFTQAPAMSEDECVQALLTGWNAVDANSDLLVTGEMGIGNTTAAAAIAAAIFEGNAKDWVGRGTGVNDEGLRRKRDIVTRGLERHGKLSPLEALRCLGGREIAAMAGAIARARQLHIPVILDGFICSSAAAVLHCVAPHGLDHVVAGHVSAEGAHAMMLDNMHKEPLLSLGLRLGEGSGAALAVGVLQGALACHSQMATFSQAGVSSA